jgi:hypothetical protein
MNPLNSFWNAFRNHVLIITYNYNLTPMFSRSDVHFKFEFSSRIKALI